MPDFSVRWKNFRAFSDTRWIDFKPLTILIGANNTGKTSVFAPLLLLKQTLDSDDLAIRFKPGGPYFDAGLYRDLIYQHNTDLTLSLSLRWLTRSPSKAESLGPVGKYPPGTLTLSFSYNPQTKSISLSQYELDDFYKRTMVRRRLLRTGRYTLGGTGYPSPDKKVNKIARKLIRFSMPRRFLFQAGDIIRSVIRAQEDSSPSTRSGSKATVQKFELPNALTEYLSAVDAGSSIVGQLLESVSYIGPLREPPRRVYGISSEKPSDVGVRGQYAPEVLFQANDPNFRKEVNSWIEKFEFGEKISARQVMDGFFTLEVVRVGSQFTTNFADTGFGMSQVFPLVVAGLAATRGSCLVLEQPEIHLNPRLQSRLADLFAEFVRRGVSVIVESHSEHILLRLRRMVAEGKIKANDISLYYVEKAQTESQIRSVTIEENGHIETNKWPKGFFEESLLEALGLAQAQIERKDRATGSRR